MTKTARDFAKQHLRKLGLPAPAADDPLADAYLVIGEAISKARNGKSSGPIPGMPSLAEAMATLTTAWSEPPDPPPTPPKSSSDAEAWLQWLKTRHSLFAVGNVLPRETTRAALRYLAELARLLSFARIADGEAKNIRLDGWRQRTWQGPSAESPRLVFALPAVASKPGSKPRVLATMAVEVEGERFRVERPVDLRFNVNELFRDGEPVATGFDLGAWECRETIMSDEATSAMDDAGLVAHIEAYWRSLFNARMEDTPMSFDQHARRNLAVYCVDQKHRDDALEKDYRDLSEQATLPAIIDTILTGTNERLSIALSHISRTALVAHMDRPREGQRLGLPLNPSQRLAATVGAALPAEEAGRVAAINGPPGTGKTSLLQAVLASYWVGAIPDATRDTRPPIVFATGHTNKAVTNIIEAFSSITSGQDTGIHRRWIDGLPSYGWFTPSASAKKDSAHLQWLEFEWKTGVTTGGAASAFELGADALDAQIEAYLGYADEAGFHASSLDAVVNALQERIRQGIARLHADQDRLDQWLQPDAVAALQSEYAWSRTETAAVRRERRAQQDSANQEIAGLTERLNVLGEHLRLLKALNPYLQTIHRWRQGWRTLLPNWVMDRWTAASREAVATAARHGAALGVATPTHLLEATLMEAALDAEARTLTQALAGATQRLHDLRSTSVQVQARRRRILVLGQERLSAIHATQDHLLRRALRRLATSPTPMTESADQLVQRAESIFDTRYRFELFHLGGRFWEGQYLRVLSDQRECQRTATPSFADLAMLCVVVVGTLTRLRGLLRDHPAGVLIVDEAGQCTPMDAVALMRHARQALVVGDVCQLKPIPPVDSLEDGRLGPRFFAAMDARVPSALSLKDGSLMRLAQQGCRWSDGVGLGVTLRSHYRCRPSIISVFNTSLYRGLINPARPEPPPNTLPLPALAWVDVRGATEKDVTGSSFNVAEIEAIGRWLFESATWLKARYRKPLDEIVAVLAPLRAQRDLLKERISTMLLQAPGVTKEEVERMVIGTVHQLQGAERPIVCFSTVQHLRDGRLFAQRDNEANQLNVAVSRAQDSFILVGDKSNWDNTVRQPSDAPMRILGDALKRDGQRLFPRTLVVIEAPGKARRLAEAMGVHCEVIATKGSLRRAEAFDAQGSIQWKDEPHVTSLLDEAQRHAGHIDEIVIATDDDRAGELIGQHAAALLTPSVRPTSTTRMRFHSTELDELREAFALRGDRFDAALLRSAYVREAARLLDQHTFRARMPGAPYVGASTRATLSALAELTDQAEGYRVDLVLMDEIEQRIQAFISAGRATTDPPLRMSLEEANAAAARFDPPSILYETERHHLDQIPGLYPANTTYRMLALAAQELSMRPEHAQFELNALYEQGADGPV